MKLTQLQVIEHIKAAANLREQFALEQFDMPIKDRRQISVIQIVLRDSLRECGHGKHVEALLNRLYVQAKNREQLYGLLPFFISVCTQNDSRYIYGDIDWDNILSIQNGDKA